MHTKTYTTNTGTEHDTSCGGLFHIRENYPTKLFSNCKQNPRGPPPGSEKYIKLQRIQFTDTFVSKAYDCIIMCSSFHAMLLAVRLLHSLYVASLSVWVR